MDKLLAETAKSQVSLPAREYALRVAEAEVRPATASQDRKTAIHQTVLFERTGART
jgi:hypothetical protein